MLLPLLRQVMPLNDGICCLTITVVKGRCARDAIPHTFNIGEFKSVKNDSTAIKHIYNEPANIIEGFNVAFYASDCWNFPSTMSMIVVESMVTHASLRCTRIT